MKNEQAMNDSENKAETLQVGPMFVMAKLFIAFGFRRI